MNKLILISALLALAACGRADRRSRCTASSTPRHRAAHRACRSFRPDEVCDPDRAAELRGQHRRRRRGAQQGSSSAARRSPRRSAAMRARGEWRICRGRGRSCRTYAAIRNSPTPSTISFVHLFFGNAAELSVAPSLQERAHELGSYRRELEAAFRQGPPAVGQSSRTTTLT